MKKIISLILVLCVCFGLSVNSSAAVQTKACSRHTYTKWVTQTKPTCIKKGKATRKCSKCKKSFSKALLAKGHKYKNGSCTICKKSNNGKFLTFSGKQIAFNSSEYILRCILGAPQEKLADTMGEHKITIYIYNKDYKNLGVFTFNDNRLKEFYTNSSSNSVTSKGTKFKLNKDSKSSYYSSYKSVNLIDVITYSDLTKKKNIEYAFYASVTDSPYTLESADSVKIHEKIVFHLVNSCRAYNNIPALTYCSKARKAAYNHSKDMAKNDYFNHDSLDGRTFAQRLKQVGINWYTCGENIIAGPDNAYEMNCIWYNSPGHRGNMLNEEFNKIGVGIAYAKKSEYIYYGTEDFYSAY